MGYVSTIKILYCFLFCFISLHFTLQSFRAATSGSDYKALWHTYGTPIADFRYIFDKVCDQKIFDKGTPWYNGPFLQLQTYFKNTFFINIYNHV